MERKLVFLALFLANAQFYSGLHYQEFEEYPSAEKTQSKLNYAGHHPLGLLNKNQKSGKSLMDEFNFAQENEGSFRKFQKATNALRPYSLRPYLLQGEDLIRRSQPDPCYGHRKSGNGPNLRRTDRQSMHKVDDDIDEKIQNMILISKHGRHLVGFANDDDDSASDAESKLTNGFYWRDLNGASFESAEFEDEEFDEY